MTYAIDSSGARNPKRDCNSGGGRNSDQRLLELLEHDDFTRVSTVDPSYRTICSEEFETLDDVLHLKHDGARHEFRQMAKRGILEIVSLGDGDWRFKIVR